MAYTTEAAVRTATGFSNTTNITSATVVAYIADADGVIDSKIGDRYSLPLSETPEIIETISRHIATGLLYGNEYGEESQNLDKGWKNRLDWAMALLDDIQTGKMKLYDTSGGELTRTSLHQPLFKPSAASSASDADDSDEQKLSMNQKF